MSAAKPKPKQDPEARAAELRQQLEHHSRRYYVLDDPEIGDDEYDALLEELRAIEREHPQLVRVARVRQRQHRLQVLDRLELVERLATDTLRR